MLFLQTASFRRLMTLCFLTPLGAFATTLNIFESPNLVNPFANLETIETNGTGQAHYNYFSFSAHPFGVPLAQRESWLWVHENTNNGEFTFGFAFDVDNGIDGTNNASINFRVIDSDTDVYVSQSDDPGEAIEVAPGVFEGNFTYRDNTDGIAVSGITGTNWTVIVDSVDFGRFVNSWDAASGDGNHVGLTLGNEYRITLLDAPSDVSVGVPDQSMSLLLILLGLLPLVKFRRRGSKGTLLDS